jgi:beta-glucuronidase
MLKKAACILLLSLIFFSAGARSQTSAEGETIYGGEKTKIVKYADGRFQLIFNGEPYFVKGIEYSADTVGKTASSNNWMFIKTIDDKADGPYHSWVDYDRDNYRDVDEETTGDFALLKAMGANTIRIYHSNPIDKEILRDLYNRFGISVIMGNFFGAYIKDSGASWAEGTDYTNAKQCANMMASVQKMVIEHKDEPYVLMWMLGNENDVAGDAANSTVTNTNAASHPEAYARALNKAAKLIKRLDPSRPVGVCNATTKLLKTYNQHSPDIDFVAFNQYSGPYGFGVLWNRVKTEFDRAVLISEFGTDSYNSAKKFEDEQYQAKYHTGAWRDIEKNSFWGSGAGNSIGGVVYNWLDKWWLIGSNKEHDITLGARSGNTQDGFFQDEWLGIVSQGSGKASPFLRRLKQVYYTYQEKLWNKDVPDFSASSF